MEWAKYRHQKLCGEQKIQVGGNGLNMVKNWEKIESCDLFRNATIKCQDGMPRRLPYGT
jgi:hypothetical protein